jgi:hypothetical protein
MSRARHHHRLRLHLPVSGKFFLIPRFPLHYNSFVPRTRLLLGRLTAWASDQAGPAGSSSGHTGLVRPSLTQKKKQKQLWPGHANLFWAKEVFDKIHLYANSLYFIPLCFNIWPSELLLCDIRKLLKKFKDIFEFICKYLIFFFFFRYFTI